MTTSCDQGYIDINKKLELYRFEQLNQTLFNNHPDAIYILDLEGRFQMVNDNVCKITAVERKVLIGRSYGRLIVKEYQEITAEKFMLAKQDQPQRYETAIVTQNGIKHLEITNFPLKVENIIVATFGIAKDITEKKQRELEFKEYAALLKAKNEELEVFRKVIAHDLRSPVANSIGFAKLLEGEMLPVETEKEVKSLLLKTVESIDAMVRDLNEVIALKSVGTEPKEQVGDSLNDLKQYFTSEIKKLNATVTLHVEPNLTLFTVKAYFDSIMRNLISNALKYHTR